MKKIYFAAALLASVFLFSGNRASAQEWLRNEVKAFVEQDAKNGTTEDGILFLGSSSFRLWHDFDSYFPGHPVTLRGFGGSSMRHGVIYFNELVKPHKPSQIVLYFGDNDLSDNNGYTVDDFMKDVECFVRMVQLNYPDTKMTFLSIKPSPSRRAFFGKYMAANERLQVLCEQTPNMEFVDVWSPMVDANNRVKDPAMFLDDSLHMTPKGYTFWTNIITPHLIK